MFHITNCDDRSEEREKLRILLDDELSVQKIPAEITEYESGIALLSD